MGKRKSSPRLATTSAAMLLFLLSPAEKVLYIEFAIWLGPFFCASIKKYKCIEW
jgi:hypothetical protein